MQLSNYQTATRWVLPAVTAKKKKKKKKKKKAFLHFSVQCVEILTDY